MARNISVEALDKLIRATSDYIDEIARAENIILDTQETCALVMGKDVIYRKQAPKLELALDELRQCRIKARHMQEQLQNKRDELLRLERDMD